MWDYSATNELNAGFPHHAQSTSQYRFQKDMRMHIASYMQRAGLSKMLKHLAQHSATSVSSKQNRQIALSASWGELIRIYRHGTINWLRIFLDEKMVYWTFSNWILIMSTVTNWEEVVCQISGFYIKAKQSRDLLDKLWTIKYDLLFSNKSIHSSKWFLSSKTRAKALYALEASIYYHPSNFFYWEWCWFVLTSVINKNKEVVRIFTVESKGKHIWECGEATNHG
jgi:hypothetical protein